MKVQIMIQVEGRQVQTWEEEVTGNPAQREEQTHRLGQQVGRVVAEKALQEAADQARRPCCCGRAMNNRGKPKLT